MTDAKSEKAQRHAQSLSQSRIETSIQLESKRACDPLSAHRPERQPEQRLNPVPDWEARKLSGVFFIGEVVDVTGHLGGHIFLWAWASGQAAGAFV